MELLEWINDELTIMAEAFGEQLTEQRQEIYCSGLADIPQDQLRDVFRRARYELKWFPKLAELRDLAGVSPSAMNDGRPGPEEAWARMPKAERVEEDSIVWCEEERAAYGACRNLLRDGDQIGARMAFKERYEKELLHARSQGKPVRWSISFGYDPEHRLATLAKAVQENRMTLDDALSLVPGERRDAFSQMLPSGIVKGMLVGDTSKLPNLPGLLGILARMRMEGTVPKEIQENPRILRSKPAERTPDEQRELRGRAKAQLDLVKRSRNGPDSGAV